MIITTDYSTENIERFLKDFYDQKNYIDEAKSGGTDNALSLINFMNRIPLETYYEALVKYDREVEYSSKDIPQISNFKDGTINILKILENSNDLTYNEIGGILSPTSNNDVARKKYGENHSKFASFFELTVLDRISRCVTVNITDIGRAYVKLDEESQRNYLKRVIYSQKYYKNICKLLSKSESINLFDTLGMLSPQTIKRRTSNVLLVLNMMFEGSSYDFLLDKIKY